MELFAKGKRALIYKEGNTIIKVEKENIQAVNRIHNEAEWLQILNVHKIGPTFLSFGDNKLHMEYIEGPTLEKYLQKASGSDRKAILQQLLKQARILDILHVNKQEMHRVTKNAIVRNKKLVLLDFERCKRTPKPKNVTQACQFIAKHFHVPQIVEKAKHYKETYADKEFREIEKCLTNTSW